jgi:hypothetical protein
MLFICTEAEAFRLLYPSARQLDTLLRVSSWRAEGILIFAAGFGRAVGQLNAKSRVYKPGLSLLAVSPMETQCHKTEITIGLQASRPL